ncbi:hypothetical protein LTR56_019240 [Elasticomyces elasticus]|nr:hypothetical protein LTR56_019240 [Elasticomyces elasticus]KAK3633248.1 hypothetical protein LTR22_020248 [Elasticomyces elasticus]KAK4910592.1 hypothetical protein LTR49_020724 [Elasticomyces elasticus]KAK5751003.1 hypothetical protein LTS12_018904 [Elasticomyces elasticus]
MATTDTTTPAHEDPDSSEDSMSIVQMSDEPTTATNGAKEAVATLKRDFESSALYTGVYNYVKQYMSRYDCSHDFNHILRVLALAKHILNEEQIANPDKKYQRQAIILAALLHDVGDRKYIQPGEHAERLIETVLSDNGCPSKFSAKVALIVEHVSWSSEQKRPQLVKAMVAAHPELGIVQDADRLDSIGAIGVGRVFAFGAVKAADRGLEGSIEHFVEKLERVETMMKTETGRRMARERTQRLQMFRGWWEEEQRLVS